MSRSQFIQIYNNTKFLSEKYPKPEKSIKLKYDNLNVNVNVNVNIDNFNKQSNIRLFNDGINF